MKKHYCRCKSLGILLAIVLCFSVGINCENVYAFAPEHLGETVDNSLLTDAVEAEDICLPKLRYSYLAQGTVRIANNGNGYVGIYGGTDCFVTCDKIKTYIYLERSKGDGNFNSYKSWEYSATNTNSLAKGFSYKVEKGYYYRLRGYHSCTKGGTTENGGTCTDGIYIG